VAIETVLFDLDDTLLDWPSAIDRAIEAGLSAAGLPREPLTRDSLWDEVRGYTWERRGGLVVDRAHWKLLFEPQVPWQRAFPLEVKAAVAAGAKRFREALDPQLFEDAVATLDELAAHWPLAMLSNAPNAKHTLGKLGLLDRFVSVTLADDPYRKPHPRAFEDACLAAGVAPARAAYVGDSFANDVEGALNAGLRAVWVDRHADGHAVPPGVVRVERLAGLAGVLAR
jgi:putative hydrolase of the HAD superfamily